MALGFNDYGVHNLLQKCQTYLFVAMAILLVLLVLAVIYSEASQSMEEKLITLMGMKEKLSEDVFQQYGDIVGKGITTPRTHVFGDALLKSKFARVLRGNRGDSTFRMHFTGDSVLAAHDCYFNESYAHVVDRLLSPIFESIGSHLVVKNLGIGDNPCAPYDMCMGTIAGGEPDIVSWDQGMEGSPTCIELFFKSAGSIGSKPALLLLDSSPTAFVSPYQRRRFYKRQFEYSNKDILKEFGEHYGAHFMSIPETLGNISPLNDSDLFKRTILKSRLYEDDKMFGHKPWHPGPHGHMLTGQIIALNYLNIMIETASEMIKGVKWFNSKNVNLDTSFVASNDFTSFSNSPKLQCATSYEPILQQEMHLSNFVTSSLVDDRHLLLDEQFSGLNPTIDMHSWHLGAHGSHLFNAMHKSLTAGYLDRKWSLIGKPENDPLVLQLYFSSPSRLYLCGPKRQPILPSDMELRIDDLAVVEEWVHFKTCSAPFSKISQGNHTIKIQVVNSTTHIAISHIFWSE